MKKLIIVALVLISVLWSVFYFVPISFSPLNAAVIYVLEKRLDAEISCSSASMRLLNSLEAEDIRAAGKGGVTLFIKKGSFSYNLISLITTGRLELHCKLQDVVVYGKASILELLTDLLSIEYLKNLRFHDINGTFFIGKEDTITQNLVGTSGYTRFRVDGVTRKDNSINLRLRLLVNDELSASIPKDIRSSLLKEEEGPWMSMLVGITGNYKEPSLRLLSDHFRLDIMMN